MSKIIREEPSYYKDFICTGNTTCKDTCCYDWVLPMDDDTVKLYQNTEGEFGEFLRSNIYQGEDGGWFIKLKEHGRCPFLTEDMLCIVRKTIGEDAQIKICQVYPRERDIKAGNYRLNRILLSCCEAARIFYKESGDKLEFITHEEESDEEISPELIERSRRLIAFRNGMVEALQSGAFDESLFNAYEDPESMEAFFNEAIYFEEHEESENIFSDVREILKDAAELRESFYKSVPDAKKWFRKTAAYFAHRLLLDTIQDGSIEGPLTGVFRSMHVLELICLSIFKSKGSFVVDDMADAIHIFGLTFEISMHNITLLKKIRNRAEEKEYTDGENSELRPHLYP